MTQAEVRVVIGGDLCPFGEVESLFVSGDSDAIFNDLLPVMDSADCVVVNLECPLTQDESPISKDGAALRASVDTAKGLRKSHIDVINLANNHILDQDEQGVHSTIDHLSKVGISYFGAGANLAEANKPHIVQIKGQKLAFVGIAEHEFSIASESRAGANPLDLIENARLLRNLNQEVDRIIVLLHGGKEHYPYPTPKQQNICRFLIEEGADAVITQHTHIAGSYELHNGKLIVYGQGNLLFERLERNNSTWFEGFLIELTFGGEGVDFRFVPYEQSRGFVGVRQLADSEAKAMIEQIEERSHQIRNIEFVKNEWRKLCASDVLLYKSRLLGHNRYLRHLNRLFNFSRWIYPQWKSDMIRNVVECETHREGLETLWRDDEIEF